MTFETRSALWCALAAAAVLAIGCGAPKPKPDGGTDGGGGDSCIEDTDCPDARLFFCNTTTATCEPACRTKADCGAAARGQWAIDYCAGSQGCECDEFKCVASLCSADVDCGATSACRNGQCVTPPAVSTVGSCQITPDFVVLKVDAKAKFSVSAWTAAKEPVVIKEGATWSAVGTALTGSGNGPSVEMTAATPTSGTAGVDSVEASFGTVKCRAKAIVLPTTVPAGQVAVVVTDELSGRPIETAKIMVSRPDGSVVQQGATACTNGTGGCTVDTDAKGYATASLGSATTYSVTAFHLDYTFTTIANYTAAGGTDANFLSIVMRRNQVDKYGGYKGTLKNVPQTSNVHAGIASMSLAGSITNLSLTQLLGPSVPTDVHIGNAINEPGVPIPAGAYLGFTDQKIKDNVSAQGLAGVCVDASGAADEAKIKDGLCGTRTAWALAGDIPLGDLPIDAFAGGTNNINISALLGRITPIFKKFNSSVVRDVQFSLKPTPCSTGTPPTPVACGTANSEWDFSNTADFTPTDLEFKQVPLTFNFATKLGELPRFKGTYVDGVFALGGANVLGRGVVPLGIGVGVNTEPADGFLDCTKAGTPPACVLPPGTLPIRMAPTHHGLEGSEYGLVVVAVSAKGLTDVSAGLAASALFARVPENKLAFDPTASRPVDLSGQAFPAFPEGAKYNYADAALPGLAGRTFKLTAALTGVGIVRVSFSDALEHRWDVLVDAAQAVSGFTLPKPPGTFADRTFTNAMGTKRSTLLVQAFRLTVNPTVPASPAVSFNGLVEFNSTNADRITNMLTAFSLIDYAAPAISFKTPNTSPATVAKGSKLVVKVKAFKVGSNASDDGVVQFSFRDAGNPVAVCPDATVATEVTAGNGEVEYAMPMSCVGTSLAVKATLMRPDGTTPLAPEVSTSLTATIQ